MINYKDQLGALIKDPYWGIGSWLFISPVLVSEPPRCLSCFWSGRSLLSTRRHLAHLLSGLTHLMLGRTGEHKLSQSWPGEEGRGRETWVAQKCFPHCSDGHHPEGGTEETLSGAMLRQTHSAAAARMVWAQCVAAVQQLNALPHVSHTAVAICVWWMCGVQWGAEETTAPPHFCYFKWLWIFQGCGHWSLFSCYGLWTAKLQSLELLALFQSEESSFAGRRGFLTFCPWRHSLWQEITEANDYAQFKKSIKYLLKWAFQVIYQ